MPRKGAGGRSRMYGAGRSISSQGKLDGIAIAKGWLAGPSGEGITAEKMAFVIERNYEQIKNSRDARVIARCTDNWLKAVAQVMEQEKREAGTETINVELGPIASVEEGRARLLKLIAELRERAEDERVPEPAPDGYIEAKRDVPDETPDSISHI